MRAFALLILYLLLLSCEELDLFINTDDNEDRETYVTSNEVLQRAYLMASLEWTPVKPIPTTNGKQYEPGVVVKGIPYSSVKEINTYLFQDVSYYTFLTAIHNPNSVIYTEDISKSPYHGVNCAPYYGSVCSSSVMHAFGIRIPYYAEQIITLPSFRILEHQSVDSLRVCDVLWKQGHVQMVFDIERQADTLYKITTFEQSGRSAHLTSYSRERFLKMWTEQNYVGYRYNQLKYSDETIEYNGVDNIEYNNDLCPSKGDKSVYRANDTITINILNTNYDEIVLMKENKLILSEHLSGDTYKFINLKEGLYDVFLKSNNGQSLPISFESIDVNVECSLKEYNKLEIIFSPAEKADYVAICTQTGLSQYYPISNHERKKGFIVINNPVDNKYCKVVFRGTYGSIVNRPLWIN